MVLFLRLDGLLEVDLVDFEEGGFEGVEFGSFFEQILDFFEGLDDLLWVFVGDLGFDRGKWLFDCGLVVDLGIFLQDGLLELSYFEVEVINLLNVLLLISKEQLFSGFKFIDLGLKQLDFLEKGIKLYFGVG